jgi:2-dehydro-3-deoxyphosphogluconate aldolase/(4S)-4-hydroxy-2-oxoglutarate aldolase
MHQKNELTRRILDAGLVVVIRAGSADLAEKMAKACFEGGITVMEVALTTPDGLNLIHKLQQSLGPQGALIGAGTVLDAPTARQAIDAGARYIVTPVVDEATIRLCNRYQIPSLPGAMTVREIILALEAGADIVKLFPGETLGPAFLRAVLAPLPHAPLMPTGGVSAGNAAEWIAAGAVALGVGGSVTTPADQGDFAAVARRARELVAIISAARALQNP